MGHHAPLHGPHRQGLYALDRPLKKGQRIVIPIAPPLDHSRIIEQYQIDDDPAAIMVPGDSARAADQLADAARPLGLTGVEPAVRATG